MESNVNVNIAKKTKTMEILNKTYRFLKGVFFNKIKKRKGHCTPNLCETLDGKKGAACCKLGYTCPFLSDSNCKIYSLRPTNCRVFPSTPDDLQLVRKCGYYW
jgi:Fe-S-cluster containining protein